MLEIKIPESEAAARILVVGVGGSGKNAINHMIEENIGGVEFIAVNTDKTDLLNCKAPTTLQIGEKLTKGLGAGTLPEIGEKAAEESAEDIAQALKGADMVFITCGMGGGTGTGASPVVARIAREMGILTIGIVTKPFAFEGGKKKKNAEAGIENLRANVDSLIVIDNNKLLQLVARNTNFEEGLKKADEVLLQSVTGISDLINLPALINLDFADVQTVTRNKGIAHIGIGKAKGDDKAIEAVKLAVASPLLDTNIEGATDVIVNVSGDISLIEANEATTYVEELAGENANIVFGAMYDPNAQDECTITVIATGIKEKQDKNSKPLFKKSGTAFSSGFNTGTATRAESPFQGVSHASSVASVKEIKEEPEIQLGFGTTSKKPEFTAPDFRTAPLNQEKEIEPAFGQKINIDNIPNFLKTRK